MSRYIYEIDEQNAIRIWDTEVPNENNAPFIFQPDWPSGAPWADAAEATAWAELFIEALLDPASEFIVGDSPAEPRKPRVAPEPTDA